MYGRDLTFAAALGILSVATAPVGAQSPETVKGPRTSDVKAATPRSLRTPDGHPDLQGIWSFANYTPLERPRELGEKTTLTEQEAAEFQEQSTSAFEQTPAVKAAYDIRIWFDQGKMSKRTSLIVDPPDGRLPPMTADAQKRAEARADAQKRRAARGEYSADGPEDRSFWERCIVSSNAGPPIKPGPYNNTVQVFQTRNSVALLHEQIHNVRVIPLDGRPRSTLRQWRGESRGRWEGDTLVVETTNFHAAAAAFGARGASENLRLVERFTRVDADTLVYEFTVDDPTTWTRPWTAQFPMTKTSGMYEYACHEGNRGMFGILNAARAAEKEEAEAAAKK